MHFDRLPTGVVDSEAMVADSENFPILLLHEFPDVYGHLLQIVEDNGSLDGSTYSIVSVAFWWGIFEPAIRDNADHAMRSAFAFLERCLETSDDFLLDALQIRVVEHLASAQYARSVDAMAGPVTLRSVEIARNG